MYVTTFDELDDEERFQKNMYEIERQLQYYNTKIYDKCFFNGYLVKCDNDVSQCLSKIDSFFALKKMFPEYLLAGDILHPEFNHFCRSIYSCYLPELNCDGCRVFIDKVTADENLFDVFKIMQYYCMQTEIRLLEGVADNGDIILFDCNQINFIHIIAFVPFFIKSLRIIMTVYPLQIRILVLTNVGRTMATLINGLKFFFPKRYHNLVFAYSEGSTHFSKYVSSSILPLEYGGETFTLDELRETWLQKLHQYQNWFAKARDEIIELEFDKLVNCNMVFGKNGTFKTLHLD